MTTEQKYPTHSPVFIALERRFALWWANAPRSQKELYQEYESDPDAEFCTKDAILGALEQMQDNLGRSVTVGDLSQFDIEEFFES